VDKIARDVQKAGKALREILGIPESNKERRRRVSNKSGRKDGASEDTVRMNYIVRGGYEVTRTGRGSDFHVEKRDLPGRVVDSKDIEIKTGSSRLSELQEETKERRTGQYKVEGVDPPPAFYQDL
jgi:hypothetical protein